MNIKPIKNEADYKAALARIEALFDATPGTPQGDELDVLATLVAAYEDKVYPMELPDPVSAIKFRMEQQGLKAKDMVRYIGSPSKVSEVLSGKRPLSLAMIRNLVNGLGIPAEVLLQSPGAELKSERDVSELLNFPLADMVKRGWLKVEGGVKEAKRQVEDLMAAFTGPFGGAVLAPAFHRQHKRGKHPVAEHALLAWKIRVMNLALAESLPPFKKNTLTREFLSDLVRLSHLEAGPRLAKESLNKAGVHLAFEAHLPKTHLDGAAIRMPDGSPLVAMTLRHDRLDNFWFTLLHELAHVALHLYGDGPDTFFDDLDDLSKESCEKQADDFAGEALIPSKEWKKAGFDEHAPKAEVVEFARRLRISPAIVAGRVRHERKRFTIFQDLIGRGKVRSLLTDRAG